MKRHIAVLLIVSLLVTTLPVFTWQAQPVQAQSDWVIDENTVYIDDANAYLSATPYNLTASGWVEFELLSKHYEGDIDLVLGFVDADNIKVKKPQVWKNNVAHNVTDWVEVEDLDGEITIYNITNYDPLQWDGHTPDIGNYNNTSLVELTINGNTTLIVAYNSHDQLDATTATFYYHYADYEQQWHIEYYPDYAPLQVSFSQEYYNYKGVDHWYYAAVGTPIQAGILYKARCWVDVPVVLGAFTSKYVWAIKPSDETIYEARTNGHLYLLDPWLSGGWDYRVKFSVDADDIGSDLTDFPILAYISISSGYNNDDVSFVFDELQSDANRFKIAVTTSDGETQCYVEIEDWDDASEQAWLHIKGPTVDDTVDQDFYLYFDADHADNTAYVGDIDSTPGENVWDSDFLAVYHMKDYTTSSIRDSTSNDKHGTKTAANEPLECAGQIDQAQDFDGSDDEVDITDINLTEPLTLEAWFESDTLKTDRHFLVACTMLGSGNSEYQMYVVDDGAEWTMICMEWHDGVGWIASTYDCTAGNIGNSEWHYICGQITSGYLTKVSLDGAAWTSGATGVAGVKDLGVTAKIGFEDRNARHANGDIDEVRISTAVRDDDWIAATYESLTDELLDWGDEELPTAPPTVATNATTNIEATTATLNGHVIAVNDSNVTERGFVWDTTSRAAPGNTTSPSASAYANSWTETGNWTTGAFNHGIASLSPAATYYARAAANNTAGYWGWGNETSFLTKPAAPTNVAATDGDHTDKVVVTWTKSSGNVTGYKIYRDGGHIDTVGDVATYDDTGADAPTVTPGTASATDAVFTDKVNLSLSGESGNNGTTHTYKVRAYNDSGDSADSSTDTGYRGTTSLTYQWYRSSGDADSDYSTLAGATTDPYDDTTAPQGTITPGAAVASDGSSPLHVVLSVSGETTNVGAGRYYKCEVSMSGAVSQNSTSDRGTRGVGAISYQWMRSSGDADSGYSNLAGATTDPHNDTTAPAPTVTGGNATATDGASTEYVTLNLTNHTGNNGTGRYFLCTLSASGAVSQNTTSNRGFRGTDTLTFQWMRSAADSDAAYSNIGAATTVPYNDTGGVEEPDGRYYKSAVSMTGASSQNSTPDRGYEQAADEPTVVTLNATSVVCTTATLRGNITDVSGGNATTRGFQYGLSTGNYSWSTNETGNYGTGAYTLGVTSLSQNTTYYYRAYAINGEGTGYGNETNFVTLAASLPIVTNGAATGITSSGATLPGTITDTGCAGVTVSVRGFEWGTSTGNYSANWTQAGSYGTGAFSRAISGLSANTTYYWRALAANPVGTNYSAERSFSTTTEEGSGATIDVSALIDYLSDFLEGPMGINSIIFILGLIAFAIWKKGWIRIVLALSVVIWGVFAMDYDIKIAIPLLAIGSVLFFMGILKMIGQRRAEATEAEG